ncbi:MAG TPA: hypothetical protein VKA15_25555, partial [Isosphaeraceae bacterium]|nr:hypothetical protein [Isosphaeraceae bacterium]
LAFGLGESLFKVIPPQRFPRDLMGTKIMLPTPETLGVAATQNAALAFGVLGLCLAGSLGVVGGLARRQGSSPTRGGLAGAVLGLALGAGAPLGLLPLFIRAQEDHPEHDLILSLLAHALIWGLLGASAGLAFAVGLGDRRQIGRVAVAGLAGAVLGAIVFELIGGTFFGLAETAKPISATWPTRLMARLLVTVGTAITMAVIVPSKTNGRGATQDIKIDPLP